ncbi:MAG: hypothetical protein ACTSQY_09955 [Candidatus Odinarchaeia archaeon]
MGKRVLSVNLTDDSFKKVDITSKALGMSRSELIEYMIQKGWHFSDEMIEMVDRIQALQNKAVKELKEK